MKDRQNTCAETTGELNYILMVKFAVNLLNVPLIERIEWLIKKINDSYKSDLISKGERDGAIDVLVRILKAMQ